MDKASSDAKVAAADNIGSTMSLESAERQREELQRSNSALTSELEAVRLESSSQQDRSALLLKAASGKLTEVTQHSAEVDASLTLATESKFELELEISAVRSQAETADSARARAVENALRLSAELEQAQLKLNEMSKINEELKGIHAAQTASTSILEETHSKLKQSEAILVEREAAYAALQTELAEVNNRSTVVEAAALSKIEVKSQQIIRMQRELDQKDSLAAEMQAMHIVQTQVTEQERMSHETKMASTAV